ncbi:MAG TPA: ferric reductase-like transmembrane domain-containing protein, partial [Jatrophihabitans sp.]|nr:ferric reductase-like transmembrane domain-containing protein [Jatrophihabitans sp.]
SGDWLTNAGRITGLLAGYAVVVLLFTMARVPYLERRVGTDRLARWHSMGGRYTVCLAVTHALLIIWGYAVVDHTSVTRQTITLWTSYPDVLMATIAVLLLVGVGVTSARAARRRMSYETWHSLHLYTYLAIALAFNHQFANGAEFIGVAGRPARIFWSALYVVVAALLLWYRMLTPAYALFRHRMRVVEVRTESRDTVSVYVTGRHLDELHAQPGQFFRWRFLTRELWWAANPYSLSAAPQPHLLRITVKITGRHSAALRGLRPGMAVLAEGPYGSFTSVRRRRDRVLLIGAGVGITPLRALFESLPGWPGDVTLLYRASTYEDLVLRDELDEIAQRRGAKVHYLVGHRRRGQADPLSPERIARLVPDVRDRDVFICGPDQLAGALRSALRGLGVPSGHIHHESFAF